MGALSAVHGVHVVLCLVITAALFGYDTELRRETAQGDFRRFLLLMLGGLCMLAAYFAVAMADPGFVRLTRQAPGLAVVAAQAQAQQHREPHSASTATAASASAANSSSSPQRGALLTLDFADDGPLSFRPAPSLLHPYSRASENRTASSDAENARLISVFSASSLASATSTGEFDVSDDWGDTGTEDANDDVFSDGPDTPLLASSPPAGGTISNGINGGSSSSNNSRGSAAVSAAAQTAAPAMDRRFCRICRIFQPLRAKHCLDCKRCVHRFDHHCHYIGQCIGEGNHRLFVVFLVMCWPLALHSLSELWPAFLPYETVSDYVIKNSLIGVATLLCLAAVIVTGILLVCHVWLMATNCTTWEFVSRDRIGYLNQLPASHNPFDRGTLLNLEQFWLAPWSFRPIDWEFQLT
eukprot:m.7689 g.7689  ORF g.7689 m.7689 type:complete len:411 (+) comp2789_c0_seq1:251-1483(+)